MAATISSAQLAETARKNDLSLTPDLVQAAETTGCTLYLQKLADSELMSKPIVTTNRAYFHNIEGWGYPKQVFSALVSSPYEQYKGALSKATLDAWYKDFNTLIQRSDPATREGDRPPSLTSSYANFENNARAFHICMIQGLFKVDLREEARSQAVSRDGYIKAFEGPFNPKDISSTYVCGWDANNIPQDRKAAIRSFDFTPAGNVIFRSRRAAGQELCQSRLMQATSIGSSFGLRERASRTYDCLNSKPADQKIVTVTTDPAVVAAWADHPPRSYVRMGSTLKPNVFVFTEPTLVGTESAKGPKVDGIPTDPLDAADGAHKLYCTKIY